MNQGIAPILDRVVFQVSENNGGALPFLSFSTSFLCTSGCFVPRDQSALCCLISQVETNDYKYLRTGKTEGPWIIQSYPDKRETTARTLQTLMRRRAGGRDKENDTLDVTQTATGAERRGDEEGEQEWLSHVLS